jgi:hypothetical protein
MAAGRLLALIVVEKRFRRMKSNGRQNPKIGTEVTRKQLVAAVKRTVERVRLMSHRQRVKSLKDSGILTSSGKLAANYR